MRIYAVIIAAVAFFLFLVNTPVFPAYPAPAAPTATIEPYGFGPGPENKEIMEFVVKIGEPKFDLGRAGLSTIVGAEQANADLYVKHSYDGTWAIISWRKPEPKDFLEPNFPANLKVMRQVNLQDMPPWFIRLPKIPQENILSFLAFYSGAFRIYLYDQSEEATQSLANAINQTIAAPDAK